MPLGGAGSTGAGVATVATAGKAACTVGAGGAEKATGAAAGGAVGPAGRAGAGVSASGAVSPADEAAIVSVGCYPTAEDVVVVGEGRAWLAVRSAAVLRGGSRRGWAGRVLAARASEALVGLR